MEHLEFLLRPYNIITPEINGNKILVCLKLSQFQTNQRANSLNEYYMSNILDKFECIHTRQFV